MNSKKTFMLIFYLLMTAVLNGCMADLVDVKPTGSADLLAVKPTGSADLIGFCQLDNQGRLIVSVKNQGNADALLSITEVEFSPGGSFTVRTLAIPVGITVNLPALNIVEGCYNPDCDFKITVDSKNQISESNEKNNSVDGKCLGAG